MDWRYTGNQPKLGPIDASAIIPVLALVIWPFKNHWSFDVLQWVTLIMIVLLVVFSRRGYQPIPAIRLLQAKIGQFFGRGMRPIQMTYEKMKIRKTR